MQWGNGRGAQAQAAVGLRLSEPPQGGRGRQGTWKFLIAWELQCQGKGRRRGGEGGEQHELTQTLPLIALVSVAESHPCCLPQFPSLYVEDKCLPCPQSA